MSAAFWRVILAVKAEILGKRIGLGNRPISFFNKEIRAMGAILYAPTTSFHIGLAPTPE
jgi:hypothetical protein